MRMVGPMQLLITLLKPLVWLFSQCTDLLFKLLRIPVLEVHDEEDHVAPIAQGNALAAAIPGASVVLTRGLGHSGGLRDAATIERVVAFLRD